jgi:signal transduction histidine kinase
MMMGENGRLIVADASRYVVYDSQDDALGRRITLLQQRQATAITVDDEVVGYLLVGSGPQEQQFTRQLNIALVGAGALAGLAAMILGLVLTGTMLRPLEQVTAAARRLGHGDLAARAPVTSDDEIGTLARDFNEMAANVERTERERRTLTADIAHELRNPLAVMRGQVEALQDGIFPLTVENLAPIRDGGLAPLSPGR